MDENNVYQPETEIQANQPTDEGVQTPTEQPAEQPWTLPVQYNKEQRELTREQAVEYAQKGMNYDKVYGRLSEVERERDEAKQRAERFSVFERIASQNNIPLDDLIKNTERAYVQKVYDQYASDPELPQKYHQLNTKIGELEPDAQAYREQQAEAQRIQHEQERKDTEFADLIAKYPEAKDLTVEQQSMLDAQWNKGFNLTDVYEIYQSQFALENELSALKGVKKVEDVNASNAAASAGPVESQDLGIQGDITLEMIPKMTPAQLEKYHHQIRKLYGLG